MHSGLQERDHSAAALALSTAPQSLSDKVAWLLAHEDLDSLLAPGGTFFSDFMEQLEETLGRAFREHDGPSLLETHRALYHLYEDSIRPPHPAMGGNQYHPFIMRVRNDIEKAWEAFETTRIDLTQMDIPCDETKFVTFMKDFCATHSLAEHRLFDFLEHEADHGQVLDFFLHEGTLVLRFCDLMVLSLLGADDEVRGELAVNFWDEMGDGNNQDRHTELFKRLLRGTGTELREEQLTSNNLHGKLDWPGLAGYNTYIYFGLHRRNYFKYMGAMGVAEYMDPRQYERILKGCRRVGVQDSETLAYYGGHAELDIQHGEDWFNNVMAPLVRKHPEARYQMVAGALMRINTTADYYDYLYRKLAT